MPLVKSRSTEAEYNRLLNSNAALKAKYGGVLEELNANVIKSNDYVKIREYSVRDTSNKH